MSRRSNYWRLAKGVDRFSHCRTKEQMEPEKKYKARREMEKNFDRNYRYSTEPASRGVALFGGTIIFLLFLAFIKVACIGF